VQVGKCNIITPKSHSWCLLRWITPIPKNRGSRAFLALDPLFLDKFSHPSEKD
jgi:hypothetical protein